MNTSNSVYDIIVLVETWINSIFSLNEFCCTAIRLLNDDSLLDQLAVTVSVSSGKIPIVASYVPPGSDSGLT